MDNQLKCVVQFALYTLLFSLKNTMGVSQFVQYSIQAFYFLICVYSYYQLRVQQQRYCEKTKKIYRLKSFLLFTLMIEMVPSATFLEKQSSLLFLDYMELINQTIIFYTWLSMFELHKNIQFEREKQGQQKIQVISIFKILFLFGYPLNSGLEIYNRIINHQVREYQIQLGLELSYGLIFIYQYGLYLKYHQINSITNSNGIKQHDPFDEEVIENSTEEDQNFYDYFRFSIISCLTLILNTVIKTYEFERLNLSHLKQSGIIILYLMFITSSTSILMFQRDEKIERKHFVEMENKQSSQLNEDDV